MLDRRDRCSSRGYTLVELMTSVAIIGVLASLAVTGAKKYLAYARSAEARLQLHGIGSAVQAHSASVAMGEEERRSRWAQRSRWSDRLAYSVRTGSSGDASDGGYLWAGGKDGGGKGKDPGIDGDGNKGHGNNPDHFDPDNPGGKKDKDKGDKGGGDKGGGDKGGGDKGGGDKGGGDKGGGDKGGGDKGGGNGAGSSDEGTLSGPEGFLCESAVPVPETLKAVAGHKYQPSTENQKDYQSGDRNKGWACLRHANSQPQYYQYNYRRGPAPLQVVEGNVSVPDTRRWSAFARGDTDGDGVIAWFIMSGYVLEDGEIVRATQLAVVDGEE
jgi:prepilin-type N-terminal cleavage/methylation domain-containing protein